MRKILVGALLGVLAASFTYDAEAQRRMGGGRNIGKQSQTLQQRQATPPATPQQGQQAAPAQQPNAAAPAAAPSAAAAARPASPWRGALIGAAAGLGLMALASYLGFGEAFATFMLFALIGLILAMVVGMFLRRRAQQQQPAYPGGYAPREEPRIEPSEPLQRSAQPQLPAGGARPGSAMDEFARGGAQAAGLKQPWGVPPDFDTAGFIARAKGYYAQLQAAWDTGNLDQLAEFTTQEMFTELTHELRNRGGGTSRTEIVTLDAALLGIETGATEHLASVRFAGTLKVDGEVEQVEEVWNLAKPVDGSTGWLLAGIQQLN
jgi:predicted lipid-binding transport protein (Tim44 family)